MVRIKMLKLFVLLLAICFLSSSSPIIAQSKHRIIRAEEPQEHVQSDADDKDIPKLEITGIEIGDMVVNLNEQFTADENWLRNLKITVKNVSKSKLKCVSVSFGLLETVDMKMKPSESWGWRLSLWKGDCISEDGRSGDRWRLDRGAEFELTYVANLSKLTKKFADPKIGSWEKLVLEPKSLTRKRKEFVESPLLLPKDIRYLDDEAY